MKQSPLISIVTPSFNQSRFIGEAIASVGSQDCRASFEHLVIDGMSTDGTVAMLQNLTAKNASTNLTWISERDSGQSEALNKGFKRANGEIIGWLNSDDRYRAGCFEEVIRVFADNPETDILYGDYLVIDESGKTLQVRREIEFSKFILLYHKVLYIPTTATFFRRRIFDEGNWLDESLQYAMDFEFFVRLAARGYRFKHVSEVLADFRLHPESKTCSAPDGQRTEQQRVVLECAPGLRHLRTSRLKRPALALLRSIAGITRYSEKLLRGYYWQQLRSSYLNSADL